MIHLQNGPVGKMTRLGPTTGQNKSSSLRPRRNSDPINQPEKKNNMQKPAYVARSEALYVIEYSPQ
ncbi:hypothetical protein AB0305_04685 [Arthrobacter sp. NPDC080086]|uniref:hypothetical protein n=1 Tax=Arthrobacter sp. NPDC080086 TaxID=3155917 RepID=UPI00344B8696